MKRSKIISIGSAYPENILSNKELEKMVATTDEWITSRTGIKERRIAGKDCYASDLALEASRKALERAAMSAGDIDMIILATQTPDYPMPSTACILQSKLGAEKAACFDIAAACSGFLYALSIADAYIRAFENKKILVVGVDLFSRIVDYQDRSSCILFGDGAGAAVVEASGDSRGIIATEIYSDGSKWKIINIPAGGSARPACIDTVNERAHYIKMQGNEVFKAAVRTFEQASRHIVESNGFTLDDIDLFIPHQANLRILQSVIPKLNMPEEKLFTNMESFGNTSAASIPIAIDQALEQGRIKAGQLILLVSFGAGITWASSLIRW